MEGKISVALIMPKLPNMLGLSTAQIVQYLVVSTLVICYVVCLECNSCNVMNNLACYSVTEMQACNDGVPSFIPFSCPANYVCTSTEAGILCQQNNSQVAAIVPCNDCNTCDRTRTFACTGVRTYALCLNGTVPTNVTGTCAPNYVCNIEYPYICASMADGIYATCSNAMANDNAIATINESSTLTSTDATTATTTIAPTDSTPSTYCAALQKRGRFAYGNNPNSSCRQYIYCFLLNGNWNGSLYTCPAELYFDSAAEYCTENVPTRCSNATTLRLH